MHLGEGTLADTHCSVAAPSKSGQGSFLEIGSPPLGLLLDIGWPGNIDPLFVASVLGSGVRIEFMKVELARTNSEVLCVPPARLVNALEIGCCGFSRNRWSASDSALEALGIHSDRREGA